MATSNDHPGLPFIQAEGYTKGRPWGRPIWIVWHSMEAGEQSDRAETTARYFADPPDGRQVSATHCGDNNSVIQTVDEDDSPWTVGNAAGNYLGINIECAGYANQTRAQWLDPFGVAMFAQLAPIVAASMTRWGIPNRWCSIDDLKAYRGGHTTHNDLRVAFGGTSHTDPGPGFPRDYVLDVIGKALDPLEDDMPMYFIETGLPKTEANPTGERVLCSNGTTYYWVADFGPLAERGIPFPDQRVPKEKVPLSFGVEIVPGSGGPVVLAAHHHDGGATGPAVPDAA